MNVIHFLSLVLKWRAAVISKGACLLEGLPLLSRQSNTLSSTALDLTAAESTTKRCTKMNSSKMCRKVVHGFAFNKMIFKRIFIVCVLTNLGHVYEHVKKL